MTPLMITLLVIAGIAILIGIGYVNQVVENNKLEKIRLKAELSDRLRRCGDITETFPGQLMFPELKLLLARLMLIFARRLHALEKSNAALQKQITELEALVGQGESIPINNAPSPIRTEEKAKEVRFQLEALHSQVTRAAQEGSLPAQEAKHWIKEIRQLMALLHIEFFNNLGQHALEQNQPGSARLAFERGISYLRKQPEPQSHAEALAHLEKQRALANSLMQVDAPPAEDEDSALAQGLKTIETDWRKKAVYD